MKILLIFLTFINNCFASCIIETYPIILVGFSGTTTQKYIKKSDCNSKIINTFQSFISSNAGKFNSELLAKSLSIQSDNKVRVSPSNIEILKVSEFIKLHYFSNEKDTSITEVSNTWNSLYIGINDIILETENSPKNGILRILSSDQEPYWIRFSIKKNILVPIAMTNINKGEILTENVNIIYSPKYLNEKNIRIETLNPYSVATKFIAKNELILPEHFNKRSLTGAQMPINILISNGNINLTSGGTAMEAGVWGQEIKVKFTNSHKILVGKIIGPGEVKVEL